MLSLNNYEFKNNSNELIRIPFINGMITKVLRENQQFYIEDGSGGIVCSLSKNCRERFSKFFYRGSVISFQNVTSLNF